MVISLSANTVFLIFFIDECWSRSAYFLKSVRTSVEDYTIAKLLYVVSKENSPLIKYEKGEVYSGQFKLLLLLVFTIALM